MPTNTKSFTTAVIFAWLALVLSMAASSAQALEGAAEQGQKKAAMCIGCHGIVGYQASFPEVHKVPMIAGQGAPYIVAALTAYQKGERKHPTMRGIAASLSEQDMADLAAYYAAQSQRTQVPAAAPPAANAAVASLLTKGNCASCHGSNFSTPTDPSYPKLGGQHADYLYVALKAYGAEGNATLGRSHAIMGAQVKPFTRAELRALADYLGGLPGELQTVPQSKFR